jgi:hypothetical protein
MCLKHSGQVISDPGLPMFVTGQAGGQPKDEHA